MEETHPRRRPPVGGSGMSPARIAPPLMRFEDTDGHPVFVDAVTITSVRGSSDSRHVSTVIHSNPPGKLTSQIFIVAGTAEEIGERVNEHRAGMTARGVNYFVQEDASNAAAFEAERQADALDIGAALARETARREGEVN